MKTAEEILRKSMENYIDHTTQAFDEWMTEADYPCVIEAMKEYAREACLEQRVNCANPELKDAFKHTGLGWYYLNSKDVLNTPEPELK